MKHLFRKTLSAILVLVIVLLQVGATACAVDYLKIGQENKTSVTEEVLEQMGCKKSLNEDGTTLYEITSIKPISFNCNTENVGEKKSLRNESDYIKNTLTFIAFDEEEAANIESGLIVAYANNSNFREGNYLGSSVYMSSTVYFTTRNVAGLDYPYMRITRVVARCTVSNGTVLKDWHIVIGQNGSPNGQQIYQKTLYGGPNPATVTPPSSWSEILMEPTGIHGAGATTFCKVQRAGVTYSYQLNNQIF
jgi:hypothetical protein